MSVKSKKASHKAVVVQKVGAAKTDKFEAPISKAEKPKKEAKKSSPPDSAKKVLDLFKAVIASVMDEPLREKNTKGFDLVFRSAGQFEKRVVSAFRKATRVATKGDKNAKKRSRLEKMKATMAILEKELAADESA